MRFLVDEEFGSIQILRRHAFAHFHTQRTLNSRQTSLPFIKCRRVPMVCFRILYTPNSYIFLLRNYLRFNIMLTCTASPCLHLIQITLLNIARFFTIILSIPLVWLEFSPISTLYLVLLAPHRFPVGVFLLFQHFCSYLLVTYMRLSNICSSSASSLRHFSLYSSKPSFTLISFISNRSSSLYIAAMS